MQSGFHRIARTEWQEQQNKEPARAKKPTQDGAKAYQIRKRREELEDDAKLNRELDSFYL